jgi:hypothetical protein
MRIFSSAEKRRVFRRIASTTFSGLLVAIVPRHYDAARGRGDKPLGNARRCGIVKLKAEPLMWPQDVGVISLPERQASGRDGPNSRQLDNAAIVDIILGNAVMSCSVPRCCGHRRVSCGG